MKPPNNKTHKNTKTPTNMTAALHHNTNKEYVAVTPPRCIDHSNPSLTPPPPPVRMRSTWLPDAKEVVKTEHIPRNLFVPQDLNSDHQNEKKDDIPKLRLTMKRSHDVLNLAVRRPTPHRHYSLTAASSSSTSDMLFLVPATEESKHDDHPSLCARNQEAVRWLLTGGHVASSSAFSGRDGDGRRPKRRFPSAA
jgi:hypothetical protein